MDSQEKLATLAAYIRLEKKAKEYVESFNRAVVNKDPKHLADACTADCRRTYAPVSLIQMAPSLEVGRSNEEFIQQEGPFFAAWSSAETTMKDLTVDVRQRKAVVHIWHHCVAHDGTIYDMENMATLYFNDAGTKVKRIHQFTDTLTAKRFLDMAGEVNSLGTMPFMRYTLHLFNKGFVLFPMPEDIKRAEGYTHDGAPKYSHKHTVMPNTSSDQQGPVIIMLKPRHLTNLRFSDSSIRVASQRKLQQLWHTYDTQPPSTEAYKEAERKIIHLSQHLLTLWNECIDRASQRREEEGNPLPNITYFIPPHYEHRLQACRQHLDDLWQGYLDIGTKSFNQIGIPSTPHHSMAINDLQHAYNPEYGTDTDTVFDELAPFAAFHARLEAIETNLADGDYDDARYNLYRLETYCREIAQAKIEYLEWSTEQALVLADAGEVGNAVDRTSGLRAWSGLVLRSAIRPPVGFFHYCEHHEGWWRGVGTIAHFREVAYS